MADTSKSDSKFCRNIHLERSDFNLFLRLASAKINLDTEKVRSWWQHESTSETIKSTAVPWGWSCPTQNLIPSSYFPSPSYSHWQFFFFNFICDLLILGVIWACFGGSSGLIQVCLGCDLLRFLSHKRLYFGERYKRRYNLESVIWDILYHVLICHQPRYPGNKDDSISNQHPTSNQKGHKQIGLDFF